MLLSRTRLAIQQYVYYTYDLYVFTRVAATVGIYYDVDLYYWHGCIRRQRAEEILVEIEHGPRNYHVVNQLLM